MAEFSVFVSQQRGSFTKQGLLSFKEKNLGKFGQQLSGLLDSLDPKLKLQLQPSPGTTTYLPLPNASSNRWAASSGSQAIGRDIQKVKDFISLLQGVERIFDPSNTGAFEVPPERSPDQDLRFTFATKKFVGDHVCNISKTKSVEISEEAQKVAMRRMTRDSTAQVFGPYMPGAPVELAPVKVFTNIPASSTLDLHADKSRKELQDEITSRQKEFEAIYEYLVSEGKRQEILLQGDHEEVMYTSKGKFDFYECSRPGEPTDIPPVNKCAQNYLRYAVQKVNGKWLLHHMAGRAAPGQENTAPNSEFQAFNYTHVPNVTPVRGTFTRVG